MDETIRNVGTGLREIGANIPYITHTYRPRPVVADPEKRYAFSVVSAYEMPLRQTLEEILWADPPEEFRRKFVPYVDAHSSGDGEA